MDERDAQEIAEVWPGHTVGIRAPDFGEVALSHHEVAYAVRSGIIQTKETKQE